MKTKHNFWQNSQCFNQYLHRFEIKEEYDNGVLEVCEVCHKTRFFKLIDGKVDNQEYMSYHVRQALPPFHPYYDHEHKFNPTNEEILSPYV